MTGEPGPFLPLDFYRRDAETVARELLGQYLVRRLDGVRLTLRIVETEAYLGTGDRASHAWRGVPTKRTATLFRQSGVSYVYLVYGLHNMFNVVTEDECNGSAVLVRAGEPTGGEAVMIANRKVAGVVPPGALAGGPGKLCQAMRIDRSLDGSTLDTEILGIRRGVVTDDTSVVVGPRVGVDYAGDAAQWPLRFAESGNRHVSRPWPNRALGKPEPQPS